MAWIDLASNECPTKEDVDEKVRNYWFWQSNTVTISTNDYTVNPGNAPWNYLFICVERTSPMHIPIPSCLYIPRANSSNTGIKSDNLKLFNSALSIIGTITVTFNGTTGDIRIQKDISSTCYLKYMVFM